MNVRITYKIMVKGKLDKKRISVIIGIVYFWGV